MKPLPSSVIVGGNDTGDTCRDVKRLPVSVITEGNVSGVTRGNVSHFPVSVTGGKGQRRHTQRCETSSSCFSNCGENSHWRHLQSLIAEIHCPELTTFQRTLSEMKPRLERTAYKRERERGGGCLLYTSPSPRDHTLSRMPSSA